MSKLPVTLANNAAGDAFFEFVASAITFETWTASIARLNRRRADRRLIDSLTDAQLRDIGLDRPLRDTRFPYTLRRYHSDL